MTLAHARVGEPEPITKPQIKAIWAISRAAGLNEADLRSLVPGGSIRALTKNQATDLIERLATGLASRQAGRRTRGGDHRRAPANVRLLTTPKQRAHIEYLFNSELGWKDQPHRIEAFCRKMTGIGAVEQVNERRDAIKLITALRRFIAWQRTRGRDISAA